jgi:hypothetical protein
LVFSPTIALTWFRLWIRAERSIVRRFISLEVPVAPKIVKI